MKSKIIASIVVIVIVIVGVIVWLDRQKDARIKKDQEQQAAQIPEVKAPAINGAEVPERLAKRRPIAVMIENHIASRPQSGLTDADIVYEVLAEGGITRFLALFQIRDPENIGPVRSVRPYFSQLANQWGAVLAHSGGSATALQELRVGMHKSITDADEFFNRDYFSRRDDRPAPHNLYTSGESLRKYIADRKADTWSAPNNFQFAAIPTHELKPEITEITIPFSTASYLVKYQFDGTTNTYQRQTGGTPTVDRNNNLVVSPKNIIVQFTEGSIIPGDPTLAMQFRLDKSGPLYLFTGGKIVSGTWRNENNRLVYLDSAGKPLVLQPGQTWIEVFSRSQQNSVTWK